MYKKTLFIFLLFQSSYLYSIPTKLTPKTTILSALIGGFIGNQFAPQYGWDFSRPWNKNGTILYPYDDSYDLLNFVKRVKWTTIGAVSTPLAIWLFLKTPPLYKKISKILKKDK